MYGDSFCSLLLDVCLLTKVGVFIVFAFVTVIIVVVVLQLVTLLDCFGWDGLTLLKRNFGLE
jgi:hypothetical protein